MAAHAALAGPPGGRASEPLVEIRTVDPAILVELRYATSRNVLHHPLYPATARAVVRQSVADRLKIAQAVLKARGYGLKILDAFRPADAQAALWSAAHNAHYVADPENGHALHTWGVAVDATLVDAKGREMAMPSEFDSFGTAAGMHYLGEDAAVQRNLDLLQRAMGSAGFRGMRSEWWHFVAPDWKEFAPVSPEQARIFTAPAPPGPAR